MAPIPVCKQSPSRTNAATKRPISCAASSIVAAAKGGGASSLSNIASIKDGFIRGLPAGATTLGFSWAITMGFCANTLS